MLASGIIVTLYVSQIIAHSEMSIINDAYVINCNSGRLEIVKSIRRGKLFEIEAKFLNLKNSKLASVLCRVDELENSVTMIIYKDLFTG